jgi:acyl-CoA hydrolase
MPGRFVAAFAFGSQKLYDFLDDNLVCYFGRGSWVNHPFTVAQNDNMVAINAALEMDLTGQCNAESIGHSQWSMTGGHHEFTFGAQESKGGKSIIAFHSTANDDKLSRIVPSLGLGAVVSTSRNDMDYIVTEYGVIRLKGLNIQERCREMIKIAHTNFRAWLEEEAQKYRIW